MAQVLFVGIDYYHYTARIVDEMRAQGHSVSFHSMELASRRHKLAKRYFGRLFANMLERHHRDILAAERGKAFDRVVMLQVHWMRLEVLDAFRAAFPAATFVLYNWDSLKTHDYRPMVGRFDRVVTFDRDDADALGSEYLPLFALPEYFAARRDRPKTHDVYFVGSIVTIDRLKAVQALKSHCAAEGLRLRLHLHCSLAGMVKLLRRGHWMRELTTRSVDQATIIDMMETSEIVYDFANHRQSGYTMRFIENLCAGVRIATSNDRVRGEPFFAQDRFLILQNASDLAGLKAFATNASATWKGPEQFSLSNWVKTLVG
jgi:hypothetical protein